MIGEGSNVKGVLIGVSRALTKKPKFALDLWKNYTIECKTKNLTNAVISQKLKYNLTNLLKRTTRSTFEVQVGGGIRAAGALKRICMGLEKKSKLAFIDWKNFSTAVKNKKMMDNIRSQKLKITLSSLPRNTLNKIFTRLTKESVIVRKSLKRLSHILTKGTEIAVTNWKQYLEKEKIGDVSKTFESKFKAMKIKSSLEKPARKVLRSAKAHANHDNTKLKSALKILTIAASKRNSDAIRLWYVNSIENIANTEKKSAITKSNGQQLRFVLNNLCKRNAKAVMVRIAPKEDKLIKAAVRFTNITITNRTMRGCFKAIIGDSKLKGYLQRICDNLMQMQADAIKQLQNRVEKMKTVKKINSACFVSRELLSYSKKVKVLRFNFWKNLEGLRRKRIMTRTAGKMMCLMSINFEGAFWKWKYITTTTGKVINPKHSIVSNRICKICMSYQKRLTQFAYFKLLLHFKSLPHGQKLTLPQALAKLLKPSSSQIPESLSQTPEKNPDSRPVSRISESKPLENPSNVSTLISGNLSKEEVNSMNQMGAFEILSLTFNEIRLRNIAWALSATVTHSKHIGHYDNERSRLMEQIAELRYERHSLLEDNNTLRSHNDNLVISLEKANEEFQTISLHLDHLKVSSMIRILSRLAEMNLHNAFISISLR